MKICSLLLFCVVYAGRILLLQMESSLNVALISSFVRGRGNSTIVYVHIDPKNNMVYPYNNQAIENARMRHGMRSRCINRICVVRETNEHE